MTGANARHHEQGERDAALSRVAVSQQQGRNRRWRAFEPTFRAQTTWQVISSGWVAPWAGWSRVVSSALFRPSRISPSTRHLEPESNAHDSEHTYVHRRGQVPAPSLRPGYCVRRGKDSRSDRVQSSLFVV